MTKKITLFVVTPQGEARVVEVMPSESGGLLRAFYELIDCDLVDVVRLAKDVDMYVDDEGAMTEVAMYDTEAQQVAMVAPVNAPATLMAHQYGFTHQPYFGTAVFVGGVNRHGNNTSLSELTLQRLQKQLGDALAFLNGPRP